MHPFVKMFLAVWFGGVAIIGGMIFIMSVGQVLSGYVNENSRTLVGIVAPLVLPFFGFLLVRFGKNLGCDEEIRILSWLERSFADTTQNSSRE